MATITAKVSAYSPEDVGKLTMIAAGNPSNANFKTLAMEYFGTRKTWNQVRAKAVSLGLYRAEGKDAPATGSKDDGPSKKEMLAALTTDFGLDSVGLDSATKAGILSIRAAFERVGVPRVEAEPMAEAA